ncbi:MAG: short-chain dehydrogenase, partial [Actinobacteria bacterium]
MTVAPLVRGLFLSALGRPVLVRPTDAPATMALPADEETLIGYDLGEVQIPVVVSVGEETFEVTGTPRGEREVSGRVAVVTGGAQGFGAEIAQGLVNQGCFVFIADLNGEGAQAKCEELGADNTHPITVNVA